MSNKKVILYLITRSDLGGAQKHLADLIKYSGNKYDIHVAVGSSGFLSEIANSLNIKVHIIPDLMRGINPARDFRALKQFTSLTKYLKPDLIHAHSSKSGTIARLSGKFCKTPVLFTVHGWGFDEKVPLVRRKIAFLAEKLMAPLTTKTICVCESDYNTAINLDFFNEENAVVIYNGVEDIDLPLAKPERNPPRLVMVARFDNKQKDQLGLIDALARIQSDMSLDFVGSGEDFEQVKAYASTIGVDNKVSFLGDRSDVPQILSKSQIFILSTHYEGFPISILEAMRAGLPIIATDVNGVHEQVEHGVNGLLVPHKDVNALATALDSLIKSSITRQQMGEMSRKKFLSNLKVEQMIERTHDLYEEILTNQAEEMGTKNHH